ncbi:HIT domain-containing protein [Xylariales sp. AK1849]|nr:HIT domain-containing protein [Xylariales sp. AK1849]
MSTTDSDPEDAITKEEITGEAPAPPASSTGINKDTTQINAFTELMKPKAKASTQSTQSSSSTGAALRNAFKNRDGLGAYTNDPASYPATRVLYYDDDYVVINDLYPKSSVHTLLLPRSPRQRLHPFEAFENPEFLASVQAEALKLRKLAAKELQRRFGKFSEADKLREAVLNGDVEWEDKELPKGRDWESEVMVGIHAHPSMNDLHVHVLSRDMFSECVKHRKHYNSFNTPFLVDVADFPLAKDDSRRHPGHAGFMGRDLKCWRCGQNFGIKFKQLKEHLALEFEEWKKE